MEEILRSGSATSSLNNSIVLNQSSNTTSETNSYIRNCIKKNVFTFALLNARSLKNKLESLKETMNELGIDICAIVETWFKPADLSIKMPVSYTHLTLPTTPYV